MFRFHCLKCLFFLLCLTVLQGIIMVKTFLASHAKNTVCSSLFFNQRSLRIYKEACLSFIEKKERALQKTVICSPLKALITQCQEMTAKQRVELSLKVLNTFLMC